MNMLSKLMNQPDLAPDLYNLSAPDRQAVERRERLVEELKVQMGDKYLLARPVKRIEPHHD